MGFAQVTVEVGSPPAQARASFAWGEASAAVLLEYLTGTPASIRHLCPACGSESHGRPFLPDAPDVDISISHADNLTLVAMVPTGRIGVDLELVASPCPEDIRHPQDPDASVELWTRKEAFVKATGEGLRRDLRTIAPERPGVAWGDLDVGPLYRAAWCWISPDACAW